MAVGPSNKGSGKLKRTTIDPRIGGTKGDAGFAGKAGAKGPGTLAAKPRTKIDPRIGGKAGDAGPAGKAKQLSGFGKAFSVALAKGPGTLFTFKGKQYKAIKKHEGKGPSVSRVEDKVSKATIVKGKRDTSKSRNPVAAVGAGAGAGAAAKKKSKAKTPASGRFGQRKAGGIMKAKDGDIAGSTAVYTQARKQAGKDRVTLTDLREAASVLGYKLAKEKRNSGAGKMTVTDVKNAKKVVGKRTGGILKPKKAAVGALFKVGKKISDTFSEKSLNTLSKAQRETLMRMPDKQRESTIKKFKASIERADKAPKLNKKKVAAIVAVPSAVVLQKSKTKKTNTANIAKPKRKEDKVSQANIIGKGSKKGRRAGGIMKANKGAFPDLSGDGKITKKDILMGRGVIKKRGGGAAIKGMNYKGTL